MKSFTLIRGKRYAVTFQIPGIHRVPYYMVADYIGDESDGRTRQILAICKAGG